MTTLIVEDELASQLQEIADDEQRPVGDVLRSLLNCMLRSPKTSRPAHSKHALKFWRLWTACLTTM